MAWCEDCARYWAPPVVAADGSCPDCGRTIAEPATTPWHFKLLVLAVLVYLGWRGWQGVVWLIQRF